MYKGDNILTISACEAKDQRLTDKIQKRRKVHKAFQPPRHFFVTASEEVYWKDAVVAWALFYNKIPNTNLSKKKKIFNVLDLIEKAELGTIHYYRWSTKKKKYICYGAQGKIKNS